MAATYTTQGELATRFGETELVSLTDRADPPSGVVDVTVVARAIADAQAEIDGYLRARYALPIQAAVPDLTRVASDVARYRLYADRPTEEVRRRYEDAVAHLRRISSGEVQLALDTTQAPVAVASGPQFVAPPRTFTHKTLRDF